MDRRTFLGAALGAAAGLTVPGRLEARPPKRWPNVREANAGVLESLFRLDVPLLAWEWIVVHHTATRAATLEGIDAYHRAKFGGGIQYHFLIGNGIEQPAGLILPARWRLQERAIHLFRPERAPRGIAISLAGNFQNERPRRAQMDALVDLARALMKGCNIALDHVTTHRRVDVRLTACPGRRFPFQELQRRLAEA